ncbi:hypothetical protein L195_g008824 [Trifolium pratense]|uniref:Uncharacterized protein n=1 Tax=Trifolium pratense TaxID=57577 RepID=A0A2K3PA73_TRIPR|nr:hypothetical protein L195_g008824 [Trifolium pratense]
MGWWWWRLKVMKWCCGGARDESRSVVVVSVLSWDSGGCIRSEKGVVWRLRRF